MYQVLGLIVIVVFSTGLADAAEDRETQINRTRLQTNETLKQLAIINFNITQLEERLERYNKTSHNKTLHLSAGEKAVISKIYELNKNVSILEGSLKTSELTLRHTRSIGYRLNFIAQLLTDRLEFLNFRKNKGYDTACFQFARNKTAQRQKGLVGGVGPSPNSTVLDPTSRKAMLFDLELQRAKWELEEANRKLAAAKHELRSLTELLQKSETVVKDLIVNISTAKKTQTIFEEALQKKTHKLKNTQEDLIKEATANDARITDIIKLKEELGTFEKDRECYNNLENRF